MSKKKEVKETEMEEMKDENIVPEEEAENQEDETPEETPEEPKKKFRITKKGAIALGVGIATAVGLIIKGIVTGRSNEEVIDDDLVVSEEDLGEPDSGDVSESSEVTED